MTKRKSKRKGRVAQAVPNATAVRYEPPLKPTLDNVMSVAPDTESFQAPEKAKALLLHLSLSIGDTIREDSEQEYTINPRYELRGHAPEQYAEEIRHLKALCTPKMIDAMTVMVKKKKFADKERDKFYQSFVRKLDKRFALPSLKKPGAGEEAILYFSQSHEKVIAGMHNCVYWLLDKERVNSEFVAAWLDEKIPDNRQWCLVNDGEYKVLTDEEAEQQVDDYLKDSDYLWREAVAAQSTTSSWEDWKEDVKNHDGRGSIINSYDGSEESIDVDGMTYYIYRMN